MSSEDQRGVGFVTGDVTDEGSVFAAMDGVKTVYHAAATVEDWAPWREFESVTIGGTRYVVAAVVRTGARLLYASSEYGVLGYRVTVAPLNLV